ncbi:unnamed protein product [Gongylonema pulchrum]|uniref:Histone-lysine N-methyltransferase SETMAR n=1 Tax=Gongylonema pulchrum TaxID=637853 RepID=A0A183DPB4_9BILA|nr:unnamed protein product [Gongylonema pulchrum]
MGGEYVHVEELCCGPGGCSSNFEVQYEGCGCVASCTAHAGCSCLLYNQDIFSNRNSVRETALELPILECSANCACAADKCENRCVQLGVSLPLQVFDAGDKGFGLRCTSEIPKGRFVIEYVGEVVGRSEVTYIDPSVRGNQSRFINHGCSPNLVIVLVRFGTPQVHVGLFALRDIPAYEELTYDYGISTLSSDFRFKKCLCDSANCHKFLPASGTATG